MMLIASLIYQISLLVRSATICIPAREFPIKAREDAIKNQPAAGGSKSMDRYRQVSLDPNRDA